LHAAAVARIAAAAGASVVTAESGQNLTHSPQQTPLFFDHLVGETEQR
jgi:hypothetical protein